MTPKTTQNLSVKPRVVIDARMASRHWQSIGIARYLADILEGLASRYSARDCPYETVLLVSKDCPSTEPWNQFHRVVLDSRFLAPSEWAEIPRILKTLNARLYHSPSFASIPFSSFSMSCPWILTIHDLNHLEYGDVFKKIYYRAVLKPFARGASVITTVSKFSQNAIAEWLGMNPTEIEVQYNAFETISDSEPKKSAHLEMLSRLGLSSGQFFFSLATLKKHKNLSGLLEAYRVYRQKSSSPWPLVLTADIPPEPGVIRVNAEGKEAVEGWILHAGAFVTPSLYEGFGRIPVEAAMGGAPLIVSDIPPHREGLDKLQGNEVLWVPPLDQSAWVSALERAEAGTLQRVGNASRVEIYREFNAEKLTEGVDRVYRRVLGI